MDLINYSSFIEKRLVSHFRRRGNVVGNLISKSSEFGVCGRSGKFFFQRCVCDLSDKGLGDEECRMVTEVGGGPRGEVGERLKKKGAAGGCSKGAGGSSTVHGVH